MIFAHLFRLLQQSQASGALIAPLPECSLTASARDRRMLTVGRFLLNSAVVAGAVLLLAAGMVASFLLSKLVSHNGPLTFAVGCGSALLFIGTLILEAVYAEWSDSITTKYFPWNSMPKRQNLQLCMPLSKSECVTMLRLFEIVKGGDAYHQAILDEGRQVYGFDLALLQRVNDVREAKAALLDKQQESQRQAQVEDAACRRIHGVPG